jgi:hypothetical protein
MGLFNLQHSAAPFFAQVDRGISLCYHRCCLVTDMSAQEATDIQIYSTGLRFSLLEAANVQESYKGFPCLSILGHVIKIS